MHTKLVFSVLQLQQGEANSQTTLEIHVLSKSPLGCIPVPGCLPPADATLKAAVATEGHEEKSWRAKTEMCKYRVRQAGTTLDLIALLQHVPWPTQREKVRADGL